MISQFDNQAGYKQQTAVARAAPARSVAGFAFLIGIIGALALNVLLPALLPMARLALFPAIIAVTIIFSGFLLRRRRDPAGWLLLIGGQLLGLLGVLIYFLAAIV